MKSNGWPIWSGRRHGVGDRVCARAFQTAVGCVDAQRGTLLWSRNAGGTRRRRRRRPKSSSAPMPASRITAWRANSGDIAWTSERLLHRGLSAPVVAASSVVFGDVEGQVHFLARDSGEPQLRLPTDGSPIVAAPVVAGGTVVVATRSGGLFAFRPQP